MVYSLEDRTEIVVLYGTANRNYSQTATLFNENHPNRNVSAVYVRNLIQKFFQTGSVNNKKRDSNNRGARNEAMQVAVLGHVHLDPQLSVRKLSETVGVAKSTCHKILKLNKMHPYKMQLYHELGDDDFDRRVEFCETMTGMIRQNRNILRNICFSDESCFFLNGLVNRHNCRFWSDVNPHVFQEEHTQRPQKINVWAGILNNQIIGPIFYQDNLTGLRYLQFLEELIHPLIIQCLEENVDQMQEDQLYFQQDGAPPHFSLEVRQYLDTVFPGHWIGRRGSIEWPARSPDLTPMDFFLWGHLKSVVYRTPPQSIDDLRNRIIEECRNLTPQVFENVRNAFENRLYYCLNVNGEHFEHLI